LAAYVTVPVGSENGGLMRVEIRSVIVQANVGFGVTDHGVTIEGAGNLTSGVVGDDKSDGRLSVQIRIAPGFLGDCNATLEVFERVKETDGYVGHGS
jgi:hypothetical protein